MFKHFFFIIYRRLSTAFTKNNLFLNFTTYRYIFNGKIKNSQFVNLISRQILMVDTNVYLSQAVYFFTIKE